MSYKFEVMGLPANWSDTAGLLYRSYSTYSGSASDSPDPASLVSGSLRSTSGSSTSVSSFALPNDTTYVWRGYFKPDQDSANWRFRVTSEDGAYLWLDTNAEAAVASLNRSNAIVDNGGTHVSQTVTSGDQNLDSDFHYAITLVAGSTGGAGSATLEWSPDGGSTWYSSGASYLSHDSRYPDGFGADTYEYVSTNTMSRLAIGLDDGIASWAALADVDDVTAWEDNIHRIHGVETWDLFDIAYGKDGSGNAMWAAINTASADAILHSSDTNFTNKGTWTEATNVDQRLYTVLWGNDVWIAAGALGVERLWRSTDGSTWSAVDISSLTFDGDQIRALTSDGAGNWWFGCGSKIYKSTDDGSSWAEEATITVGASGLIRDLVYTNSTVVVLYKYDDGSGTQEARVAAAAASDTTDWSSGVHLSSGGNMHYSKTTRSAAGNGRVVFIDTGTAMAADVNGKTITIQGTRQTMPDEGNVNCIATDGAGTWWIGSDGGTTGADGGDICRSNDNGLSWTRTVHGIRDFANHKVESMATNQYLPL